MKKDYWLLLIPIATFIIGYQLKKPVIKTETKVEYQTIEVIKEVEKEVKVEQIVYREKANGDKEVVVTKTLENEKKAEQVKKKEEIFNKSEIKESANKRIDLHYSTNIKLEKSYSMIYNLRVYQGMWAGVGINYQPTKSPDLIFSLGVEL